MPINPQALSSSAPEPDEQPPSEAAAQAASGDTNEQEGGDQPKRKRRTKAELIAAAVVPGMDDVVEIKDAGTGAKIDRQWRVAVEMVRDGKAEWANSDQKYAFLKYEQERASSAFSQDAAAAHSDTGEDPANPESDRREIAEEARENNRQAEMESLGQGETHDASGQRKAPEGADLGDEVVIGPDTYVVGHGHVLVQGVVAVDGEIVQPKRRWKRELGDASGPFVAEQISRPTTESNGNGKPQNVTLDTERLPRTVEQVSDGGDGVLKWKIGNGILEKIGLPDYSSLQVGPISASRMVVDDGRRTAVTLNDGRSGEVPTAVIEAFEEIDNTVEYIASRFRGQLQAFLQATGALKQPVA